MSITNITNITKNITKRYPDKVPVIVKVEGKGMNDLDKKKYLVPKELVLSQFIYVIRKRLKLKPEEAIFIFFGNNSVNTSSQMVEIYEKYKNKEDLMLYAVVTKESTFG